MPYVPLFIHVFEPYRGLPVVTHDGRFGRAFSSGAQVVFGHGWGKRRGGRANPLRGTLLVLQELGHLVQHRKHLAQRTEDRLGCALLIGHHQFDQIGQPPLGHGLIEQINQFGNELAVLLRHSPRDPLSPAGVAQAYFGTGLFQSQRRLG